MYKVALAGVGDLYIAIADRLIREGFTISQLVVSKRSPEAGLEKVQAFAAERNIPVRHNFSELTDEQLVFTPNYPVLIKQADLDRVLFVNVHYAVLPRFRGIHPIQAGLLNYDKVFGYTVHQIDTGIDSGPVYFQHKMEVAETDNTTTITNKLTDHLVDHIADYLKAIIEGKATAVKQDDSKAVYAGRRRPEDGQINWHSETKAILALVRSVPPPYYPGAFTFLKGEKFVISEAEPFDCPPYLLMPGQILNAQDGRLLVKTADTAILVTKMYTPESGAVLPMDLKKFSIGARFE